MPEWWVCSKLRMAIANVLWKFRGKPKLRAHICQVVSALGDATRSIVARLTGLVPKTVFQVEANMLQRDWVWSFEAHHNQSCRPLPTNKISPGQGQRGHDNMAAWLPPLGDQVREIATASNGSGDELPQSDCGS